MTHPDFSAVLCRDAFTLNRLYRNILRRDKAGQPTQHQRTRFQHFYQQSHAAFLQRRAALPKPALDADLPVLAVKEQIRAAISEHQVVIISGETGSGKTTQLPQICLDSGLGARGMIAHTQPRRIAARSVAERIAEELHTELGQAVGYQVRFDEKYSADTVIKLMTDGMLLAETLTDKYLNQYEVIIVDEAHERSLNIDFLLGYLRRLIDKRPSLKIIITSATIDAEKFSRHFRDAPVLNVSGRGYPVEIRYAPPEEDEELCESILKGIETLDSGGRGDILIFLPTERDIRETAAFLEKQSLAGTDILPLFGRLSLNEQRAVFHPQGKRRIVLATNVAETSLTVPRIKYVIDTGTARISRYSLRSKTQRLPIEAVSQAAADQRAGRCGRTSPGVCLRLYSEEDYRQRPEYTEPEILRTNLAAVILQMLTLNLGEIGDFPFADMPDPRQINDGYRLLFELQAVDERNRLTPLGRNMAKLPIDPRFSRIVFAAEQNGCLHDALIVVAFLSIQDPRERPFGFEQQADQKQGEFADKSSDFQTLLNLFAAYRRQHRNNSNNQLRRWCRQYYLNAQRMREWRELVNRLIRDCRAQKLKISDIDLPAARENMPPGSKGALGYDNPHLDTLHRSLLPGFLDQTGIYDEQQQLYQGPRNRRFILFPAGVLAKKKPASVMAADITEINRTYARTCAPLNLDDLATLAAHLTKHTYSEPHWAKKAGNVMALQTTLLYGMPLSSGRKVPFAGQNPALAHEIFVQEALVTGEIHTRLSVIRKNRDLLQRLEELEHKTRSRGILADEQQQAAFYFARLPESVHSTVTLEQWAKKHGENTLRMQESDLLLTQTRLSKRDYPESLNINGQRIALEYHFNPGGAADGITALIPLPALNALQAQQFERLIPAMLTDKIEAMLRAMPKYLRRKIVPIPDFARAIEARIAADDRPLNSAIRAAVFAMNGVELPEDALNEERLDEHLRMNYRLFDAKRRPLAESRDLSALQQKYAGAAAAHFQHSTQNIFNSDRAIDEWQWDSIPEQEKTPGGIIGYPALTLDDGKLYLRLHDNPQDACRYHREGVLTLLHRQLQPKLKYLRKNLPGFTRMSLYYRKIAANHDSDTTLIEDIITALPERVCLTQGIPRTRQAYTDALARGEKNLLSEANALGEELNALLKQYSSVNEHLRTVRHKYAKTDMQTQLARLIYPGFIRQTPAQALHNITRYLQAMNKRIEKLNTDPMKDLQRQRDIQPWLELLQTALSTTGITHPGANQPQNSHPKSEAIQAYFWLCEEYRIQLFAQELGTPVKVSPKRLSAAAALWQ